MLGLPNEDLDSATREGLRLQADPASRMRRGEEL
jgi:hypothetical protein